MKSILAILMGLFCVSGVSAQDKCKLDVRSRVGDKVTHKEKFSMEGAITVTMGEIKQEMEMLETKNQVSIDHVLSIDEDGWRNKVRRTVKTKVEKSKNPGEPEEKETVSPLEGKTFVLIQEGDDSRYEEIPEGIEASDLSGMDLRRPIFVKRLPKGDVSVGQTWEIPEKELLEDWAEDQGEDGVKMSSGSAEGTLKGIEEEVATVVYVIKMEGKTPDGMANTMALTVTARIDHIKGQLLSLHGKGTMIFSGEMEQGGQAMELSGNLSMKMAETYSYE
ncbi:MAG: hypothetical protein QF645_12270 [Planctomycetota bacterium]|jgi:hypothetical protein|nr:hypothetical protein [Planctomycetota bacterium]